MNKTLKKTAKFSKGKANQVSLADRMKEYEEVTTGTTLVPKLPIYARIDMRAGHSFCHDLAKPFDDVYANAMQAATAYIVDKCGAALGYCQSDEASFVWIDHTKVPFETRLFKLQSVLASMFTSAFMMACLETKLEDKFWDGYLPSFDCRVCNMPSLEEAANMILWRERDSIKNSITLLALEHYSTKQLDKKDGKMKIKMLKDEKGIDYFKALSEEQRQGAYFRKENYMRELSNDELQKIPAKNRPAPDADGKVHVMRSHVVKFELGSTLESIKDKVKLLFSKASSELTVSQGGHEEDV